MANGGRQIFQDASSDEDSIGLDSTEPSDPEDVYGVEKILDETWDKDLEEVTYLVKWEGYPLHKSTWEPAENFGSNLMIEDWKRQKALIEQGKEEPFNREEFYELEEKARFEQAERKERRDAKRRRLGITRRPTPVEPEDTSEGEPIAARKRQKISPVRRKGVAQTIKKPSSKSRTSVKVKAVTHEESEDDQDGSRDSDSGDSLMDELQAKSARRPKNRPNAVATERTAPIKATKEMSENRGQAPKKRTLAARRASEARNASPITNAQTIVDPPVARPEMLKSSHTAPTAMMKAPAASTARASGNTSQPSTGAPAAKPVQTAKRTSKATTNNVFTSDWDKQKKGRVRVRVSGETPKDSSDPKFTTLAQQNRFQKYSVNEPTPDVSNLAVFNPATGRMEQPAGAATAAQAPPPRPRSSSRQGPVRQLERPVRPVAPNVSDVSARAPAYPPKAAPMRPQAAPPERQPPKTMAPPVQAQSDLHRAFGRRATPPPERARSLSPPAETSDQSGPQMYLHGRTGNPTPEKSKMTVCQNWLAGRCVFDTDCWFLHGDPRPPKKDVTCTYWLRKEGCKKPDWECDFAHRDTGLYRDSTGRILTENPFKSSTSVSNAGATSSNAYPLPERTHPGNDAVAIDGQRTNVTVASPDETTPSTAAQYQTPATAHALRKGLRRELTCSHWLKGDCRFSEASCIFAHHDTGKYERGRDLDRIEPQGPLQPTASCRPPLPERSRSEQQPPALDIAMEVDAGGAASEATPVNDTNPPTAPMKNQQAVSLHAHAAKLGIRDEKHAVTEVAVRLVTTRATDKPKIVEIIDSKAQLDASRMVNAADLQHFCGDLLQKGMQWPVGDVTAEHGDRTSLASFVEICKLNVTCGIVTSTDFTLLFFPSGVEEWKFLGRVGDSQPSHGVLRFKLLPALPAEALQATRDTGEMANMSPSGDPIALASRHILGLDMDRLLRISVGDDGKPKTDNLVFIMMPPSRQTEQELLEKAFRSKKCKVVTSSSQGSWDRFRRSEPGPFLLVVHPEVPLHSIPSLGLFLSGYHMRVFSVGVDLTLPLTDFEDAQTAFSCQRLFPHGAAVFITDGVLMHHPGKAADVIEAVYNSNKSKPSQGSRTKVVMRPGIREFLSNLALVRTEDRGRTDDRWLRLLDVVRQMTPPEFDLDHAPGNPGEKSDIVSLPPEQLPTFGELWQTDQDAATDFIVNWYAGWSILNAENIRRFTICNETPPTGKTVIDENMRVVEQPGETDPKGWGKEYQHLLVVQPSWWLKKLK